MRVELKPLNKMPKPVIPLTAAKAHLRVEHDLDDAEIELYLEAAIDRTLQEIGLAGVLEEERVTETPLASFGFLYPVQEILSVEKRSPAGDWLTVPAAEYALSGTVQDRQMIELSHLAGHVSGSSYRVTWQAGLGAQPPAWFRVAVFFLLAHYYENRSSTLIGQGVSAVEVPMGFRHLTGPHKRWFFA